MGVVSARLHPLSEHPCRGFGRNTVFLVKKRVFPNVLKSTSPNYCQGKKEVLIKARDSGRVLRAERSGSGSSVTCASPLPEAAERSKKGRNCKLQLLPVPEPSGRGGRAPRLVTESSVGGRNKADID